MGDILERLAKPPIQEPEMNHESDDAWLARQVKGMDRSEIQNLARRLAWTAWWLQESLESSWIYTDELLNADQPEEGDASWSDPPQNRFHRN